MSIGVSGYRVCMLRKYVNAMHHGINAAFLFELFFFLFAAKVAIRATSKCAYSFDKTESMLDINIGNGTRSSVCIKYPLCIGLHNSTRIYSHLLAL